MAHRPKSYLKKQKCTGIQKDRNTSTIKTYDHKTMAITFEIEIHNNSMSFFIFATIYFRDIAKVVKFTKKGTQIMRVLQHTASKFACSLQWPNNVLTQKESATQQYM